MQGKASDQKLGVECYRLDLWVSSGEKESDELHACSAPDRSQRREHAIGGVAIGGIAIGRIAIGRIDFNINATTTTATAADITTTAAADVTTTVA